MKKEYNKDEKEDELTSAFNGSLDTLSRINNLLMLCSEYAVNDNILAYKKNLLEVFKESQGFLSANELKTAYNFWVAEKGINHFKITTNTDEGVYLFDEELPLKLQKFDFWIRLKLHRKQVTMAKKRDSIDKIAGIKNRYGIN